MREELISFETAKLAKEKGFNGECNHYYNNYPPTRNNSPRGLIQGKVYQDHNGETLEDGELLCSAPTQSLLQKWLREVHDIHVTVHHYKNGSYSCHISDSCDNCMSTTLFGESFKTYEKALERGLQETLKLI